MFATLKQHAAHWFNRPREPESGAVVLVQQRVYILPTRHGLLFAGVLLMMLLGVINYALSLGFVLTFLLAALLFNSMLFTFRNLAQLSVTGGRSEAVFAGGTARFTLHLSNTSARARHAIGLTLARERQDEACYCDVDAGASATLTIGIKAPRRGRLRPGRLTLFTRFPLGLYHAWSYVRPDIHCMVYPRPAPPGEALPLAQAAAGAGAAHGQGQDDFTGLRNWHRGDPPRHVAWKAAARGQGLHTKQFSGNAAPEVWLDWDLLPQRLSIEQRLSLLARQVIDADATRLAYGLRLPGVMLPLASGAAQMTRCLEALALFELPEGGSYTDESGD